MPVVTFTTDFGTRDGYVGAMKGVVLQVAPDAVIVDITHEIPPFDVAAGAFALAQAASHFPAGTIHVAVVDPGVGGDRADLVLEAGGSYFVGPDNGLLSLAARGPRVAHRIEAPGFRREPVSPTFHGRDVFAPTAGRLAAGATAREAGSTLLSIVDLAAPDEPRDRPDELRATVIHVDRFGNLVLNVSAERWSPGRFTLRVKKGEALEVAAGATYGDVASGDLVVYAGSAGFLELGVREGSAARRLGCARGDTLTFEAQT